MFSPYALITIHYCCCCCWCVFFLFSFLVWNTTRWTHAHSLTHSLGPFNSMLNTIGPFLCTQQLYACLYARVCLCVHRQSKRASAHMQRKKKWEKMWKAVETRRFVPSGEIEWVSASMLWSISNSTQQQHTTHEQKIIYENVHEQNFSILFRSPVIRARAKIEKQLRVWILQRHGIQRYTQTHHTHTRVHTITKSARIYVDTYMSSNEWKREHWRGNGKQKAIKSDKE